MNESQQLALLFSLYASMILGAIIYKLRLNYKNKKQNSEAGRSR